MIGKLRKLLFFVNFNMDSKISTDSASEDKPCCSPLRDCELERMSSMLEPISCEELASIIESFRWSDDESVGCSDDEPVCWSDANPFRWSARMIVDSDDATSNDSLPSVGSDDVFGSTGPSNMFQFDLVQNTEAENRISDLPEKTFQGHISKAELNSLEVFELNESRCNDQSPFTDCESKVAKSKSPYKLRSFLL